MNVAAIVREIDADIKNLKSVRRVLTDLWNVRAKERPRRDRTKGAPRRVIPSAPTLTVLPPKVKREYRPRNKPLPQEHRALASPISEKPVFVARSASPAPPHSPTRFNEATVESIETAVRRNLLGRSA